MKLNFNKEVNGWHLIIEILLIAGFLAVQLGVI